MNNLSCPICNSNFNNTNCIVCLNSKEENGIFFVNSDIDYSNYSLNSGLAQYLSDQPSQSNDYFLRFIPPFTKIILDVGGGDGNALVQYALNNPDCIVYVCDLDYSNLLKLKKRGVSNLIPICCSADFLPFQKQSVDVIFTLFMVEHLDDHVYSNFLLKSMYLLKKNGTLIVASDSPFYDKYLHPLFRLITEKRWFTSNFLEKYNAHKIRIHHHNLKSPTNANNFIAKHGFFIQEVRRHFLFGRYIIFGLFFDLFPFNFVHDLFSSMYVVVSKKVADN